MEMRPSAGAAPPRVEYRVMAVIYKSYQLQWFMTTNRGRVMSLAWGGVRHVMGIERRGFEPSSPPLPLRVIMLASAAKPAAQYCRPILH